MKTSKKQGGHNSSPLDNLRSLRIAVFHPQDEDGLLLTQQLQRIGCQVRAYWPPLPTLPPELDVIFIAVRPDIVDYSYEWMRNDDSPLIIAVVTYESPTIIEAVLRIGVHSVLPTPIQSFGLLSTIVVAKKIQAALKESIKKLRKLESKLAGMRSLSNAKQILMKTKSINESQAYDLIRGQAMSKRVSTEEIAMAIVNANDILNG